MSDTSNVAVGKPKIGGAVSVAPIGTTVPTTADGELNTAFVNLGYVSEDGMTQTITRESENIRAWGGDIIYTSQTEYGVTFEMTFVEVLNPEVKKTVYGDENVTGTIASGITAIANSKELTEKAWVIDTIVHGAVSRIVIPNGKVSEIGEITYADDDVIGYPVTITALPDSTGNCAYEYTKTV